MKENGKPTHLIPWPGPHATPEMVIFDDPALIAIQSSPNGKCQSAKFYTTIEIKLI